MLELHGGPGTPLVNPAVACGHPERPLLNPTPLRLDPPEAGKSTTKNSSRPRRGATPQLMPGVRCHTAVTGVLARSRWLDFRQLSSKSQASAKMAAETRQSHLRQAASTCASDSDCTFGVLRTVPTLALQDPHKSQDTETHDLFQRNNSLHVARVSESQGVLTPLLGNDPSSPNTQLP